MQRPHNIPAEEPTSRPDDTASRVQLAREASLHSLREARRATRQAVRRQRRYRWRERLVPRHTSGAIRLVVGLVAATVVVVLGISLLTLTPIMAVQNIEVSGVNAHSRKVIARALVGLRGQPVASVSARDVQAQLTTFSDIQSFQSSIRLPDRLVVHVVPRVAIGYRQVGERYETFDAAGVVLSQSNTQPTTVPRFANPPGTGARFAAAAAVMLSLPLSVRRDVSLIKAATPDDVTLHLDGNRTVLWGNAEHSGLKATVLAALLKARPNMTTFDVSAPNEPLAQ